MEEDGEPSLVVDDAFAVVDVLSADDAGASTTAVVDLGADLGASPLAAAPALSSVVVMMIRLNCIVCCNRVIVLLCSLGSI